MDRIESNRLCAIGGALSAVAAAAMGSACTAVAGEKDIPNQPAPEDRPNILFILADDMTFEAIHALGNDEVITPNLDRLVEGGTAFVNTYIMGGWHGAISVASRSMLLTGRYLWHSRAAQNAGYSELFKAGGCWPQVMKKGGYDTYMTGKWHIDHITPEQVFDVTADVRPGGMPGANKLQYDRPLSENDDRWLPWDRSMGGYWAGGRHWSEVQADDVIGWLEDRKDEEDPFFMYVAFNAPHDPRQSPKEYVDMYDVDNIRVPENFSPEHPLKELMGCPATSRDEKLAPFPRTEYAVRKHRQEYYAIITHLDAQIGRIMDSLEKTGLLENTVVVFAADNGLSCGHHGLFGKQNMYEHSMRVPLVFYGKGIPSGQKVGSLVYMHDLVPTVYEIADISSPSGVEYRSFMKSIKNPGASQRNAVYGAFTETDQRMVCDGRYKLFFIPKARTAYLFDLKNDPEEMTDLFGDRKYSGIVERLAKKYLELSSEAGDPLDITQYYPEIFK